MIKNKIVLLVIFCVFPMVSGAHGAMSIYLDFAPRPGLTGYQIESFESTTLLPGLTIALGGGTTLASLPALFDLNSCGALTRNTGWDGSHALVNTINNQINNCSDTIDATDTITFNYAPGALSFGIGLGGFNSSSTLHRFSVNGVYFGPIDFAAYWSFAPEGRNGYFHIEATEADRITSVGFQNLSKPDLLIFDYLTILPPVSAVPEPSTIWLLTGGGFSLVLCRSRGTVY